MPQAGTCDIWKYAEGPGMLDLHTIEMQILFLQRKQMYTTFSCIVFMVTTFIFRRTMSWL